MWVLPRRHLVLFHSRSSFLQWRPLISLTFGCVIIGGKLDYQCVTFILPDQFPSSTFFTVLDNTEKVQVGKDQEKAQSEKDSHSKKPRWEKPN